MDPYELEAIPTDLVEVISPPVVVRGDDLQFRDAEEEIYLRGLVRGTLMGMVAFAMSFVVVGVLFGRIRARLQEMREHKALGSDSDS